MIGSRVTLESAELKLVFEPVRPELLRPSLDPRAPQRWPKPSTMRRLNRASR